MNATTTSVKEYDRSRIRENIWESPKEVDLERAKDEELVELSLDGNRDAFRTVVVRYRTPIYNFCYRMVRNPEEAEDISQEVFLRIFRFLDRYNDQWKFSTWIYRIAFNLCVDALRKRKRNLSLDNLIPISAQDLQGELHAKEALPDAEVEQEEQRRYIRRAIDSLPPKYQTAITLYHLKDMSYEEIARMTDMPIGTVKTRVHRGRRMLVDKLQRYFN